MPETTTSADYTARIVDALIDVIQKSATPELAQTQLLMARRLALSGNVVPSRIPAPQNITEVGGYLNLLESLAAKDLRSEMLSSVLGVAGSGFPPGLFPQAPSLFFVSAQNDRPGAGAAQAAIPVTFSMRADFIGPFRTLLAAVHAAGCQLPLLSASGPLPPAVAGSAPPADLLRCLGRTLSLAPTAALADASTDALALGRLTAGPAGSDRVLARAIDLAAPQAPAQAQWTVWQRDAATGVFDESDLALRLLDLAPLLNAAGWYRLAPVDVTQLARPESWATLVNVTGLVAGQTRLRDELALLYTTEQVAASSVRDALDWVWNGSAFAPA
jgi:hypothetical protein